MHSLRKVLKEQQPFSAVTHILTCPLEIHFPSYSLQKYGKLLWLSPLWKQVYISCYNLTKQVKVWTKTLECLNTVSLNYTICTDCPQQWVAKKIVSGSQEFSSRLISFKRFRNCLYMTDYVVGRGIDIVGLNVRGPLTKHNSDRT